MSLMKVKYLGSSVLHRQAKQISVINREIINLAEDMIETMYKYCGVGLAAPQVGVSKQMIVVDCGEKYQKETYILINPKIVSHKGTQIDDEGCLSLPGMYLPVVRADYVAVEAMDLSGKKIVIEGNKLLARCLQHEIDHLNGKTFDEMVSEPEKLMQEIPLLKERIEAILRGDVSPFPTDEEISELEAAEAEEAKNMEKVRA
ncbi:MAG: peptide deformylase [Candidatus Sericytochromatia bacterium]|nr:peptide deformylase [Candidatus Sericytochromatia bacterium]